MMCLKRFMITTIFKKNINMCCLTGLGNGNDNENISKLNMIRYNNIKVEICHKAYCLGVFGQKNFHVDILWIFKRWSSFVWLFTYCLRRRYLLRGPRGASSITNMIISDLHTPINLTMLRCCKLAIRRPSFIISLWNHNKTTLHKWKVC